MYRQILVYMTRYAETNEITSEVRPQGNGACVYVPKAWIGKAVKVTILKQR